MSLIREIDEVFLRVSSIFVRVFQIFTSLFVLAAVGQFINDLSTLNIVIPGRIVAIEVIACAATLYGILIVLPTCCCGVIFFISIGLLDIVFTGLFITCAALLSSEASGTCAQFGTNYFGANENAPVTYDCGLMRAVFAFCIINM